MEWEFNAQGDISCTPAIDEERVYFGANNMKLFCLDRKIGKPIWEFETNGAMFSSPAIYNEKLFCGSTDSTIYCIYSPPYTVFIRARARRYGTIVRRESFIPPRRFAGTGFISAVMTGIYMRLIPKRAILSGKSFWEAPLRHRPRSTMIC